MNNKLLKKITSHFQSTPVPTLKIIKAAYKAKVKVHIKVECQHLSNFKLMIKTNSMTKTKSQS